MKRFVAVAVALALFPASVSAQPPTLSYTLPAAAQPGQSLDLVLSGANLAGSTGLWTNAPATIELTPGLEANNTKPEGVSYRFTVPADAAVGVYGLRVATPTGLSNVRLVMIDDLASVVDNGANKDPATAQVLTLPVAVDGACEAESFDYYKFTAAAGQRVSVEVVARRLGSPLDPVIRLLDSTGVELAYSDDEAGLGADGRLAFQIAAAGDYLLEIRDIRYAGSGDHRYRLRLGDFPLANTPYPLAAQKGTSARLAITGSGVAGVAPVQVSIPAQVLGDRWPMSVRYPQGGGSVALQVVGSDMPEQIEFEPNDVSEASSNVTLPGCFSGRFEAAKDRDWYDFAVKAGTRLVFTGRTRGLGSPTDLFLRLYKTDGSLLVEAEDAGLEEGVLDYTFPEDATYRLMVEDLSRRGGPEHVYRLEVQPYRAGFTLALEAEKVEVPRGGVFVAKVTCVRREYNGPITLGVVGLDGSTLANNVIPEGQAEVVMSVTVPATIEPGVPRLFQVTGQARIGEVDFLAQASTRVPLKTLLGGLSTPPAALDGQVGLSVGTVFADFFQLAVDGGAVAFPQLVGTNTFLVKATRLNGFDDAITLAVDGLPQGVTATVAPVEKGKPEVALTLTGPGSLAEGEYPFRVVGSASFQNQPKTVVLGGLLLKVVKPIAVTLVPTGPMAAGGTQKVKVVVTRHGAAAGAVTVSFRELSQGLVAPPDVVLADGQTEVEIDLTAAADTPVGTATLIARATIMLKDKPVQVESTPATCEIMAAAAVAAQ